MKRKLTLLIAVIAIVAMFASVLAGCSFIKENKDRVANEPLITVTRNGITLEVSKNALLDYFNTVYSQNYQYIQAGYFTVDKIIDSAVEGKIKNTYLLIDAMQYLTNKTKTSEERFKVLKAAGKAVKLEDVLTVAEWVDAVYSVNKSIEDQIEAAKENSYQSSLDVIARKVDNENVESIRLTEEAKNYLKKEYYENENIDFDKIKVEVVYKDKIKKKVGEVEQEVNRVSEPFIVSKGMYSKEFTTKFGEQENGDSVDKTLEISFKEKTNIKETPEETHTITHDYKLIKARPTKNKKDEIADDNTKIKIGDIIVGRYDTVAQLKEKGIDINGNDEASKLYRKRDLIKEAASLNSKPNVDENLIAGYRTLNERMKSSYKEMDYYYYSAFEISVMNALRNEIHKKALAEYKDEDLARETVKELKYLYEKDQYKYGSDDEKNKKDFKKEIADKVNTIYYYPKMDDVRDNFYVYNLLIKFSPEVEKKLTDLAGDKEALEAYREYALNSTLAKASNVDYDAEYKCPLHKDHKDGEKCTFGEGGIKDGKVCPAIRYGRIGSDGKLLLLDDENYKEKAVDVMARLQAELLVVKNDATLNETEKSEKSVKIFEKYMYTYNDDAGIMNNTLGYYGKNEGFQKEFVDLAKNVWAHSQEVGNAFDSADKLGHAFSSYGVHIVMISSAPFSNAVNDQELKFANDTALIKYFKTDYNVDGDSIYKDIEKKLKDQKKNTAYSDFVNKIVPEKTITRNDKNNKVTLDKSLKGIVTIEAKKLQKIFNQYLTKQ